MDNNIAMTRMQPVKTPAVEAVPRQSTAPTPPASADSAPPTRASAPEVPVAERADLEALAERVSEQISEFSRQAGRQLEFQVQNESGRVVILVKGSDGEVVRAIPPEEIQRLSEALQGGVPALIDLRA